MLQVRIHGVDQISLDVVATPSVGAGDILLKTLYCGICGSDFGFVASGGVRGPGQPMALGHEFSAEIHSVGSDIPDLKAGDRVVVNPLAGGNFVGNGGSAGAFARYVLIKNSLTTPDLLYKIPAQISDRAGALVEPMAVALHALQRARIAAGDKVLIMGAGPIGLCTTLAAAHCQAGNIVASDLSDYRLELATRLGAQTINGNDENFGAFVNSTFGSRKTLLGEFADTDIIVETTGSELVLSRLIAVAAPGTRIVTLALPKKPSQGFDFSPIMTKEIELIGSLAYGDSFAEAIKVIADNGQHINTLVSHDYPLTQFDEAFATAQQPGQAAKVLIDCQA